MAPTSRKCSVTGCLAPALSHDALYGPLGINTGLPGYLLATESTCESALLSKHALSTAQPPASVKPKRHLCVQHEVARRRERQRQMDECVDALISKVQLFERLVSSNPQLAAAIVAAASLSTEEAAVQDQCMQLQSVQEPFGCGSSSPCTFSY